MTNSGSLPPAGFYADPENPSGPHRWWDGTTWTEFYQTPPPPPPPANPGADTSRPSAPAQAPAPSPWSPNTGPTEPSVGTASPSTDVASAPPPAPPDFSSVPASETSDTSASSDTERPKFGIPPRVPDPDPEPGVPGTFPGLGAVFSGGWKALVTYWKPLLAICVPLIAIPATLYVMALYEGFDGFVYDYGAGEVSGSTDNPILWNAFLILMPLIMVIGGIAAAALLIGADANTGDRTSFGAAGPAIKRGLVRFPIAIGWGLLFALAGYLIFFAWLWIGLQVSAVLAMIFIFAVLAALIYLEVKWGFVQFAIADGANVPFARSSQVSNKRWWRTFGTMLLIGFVTNIVVGILTLPVGALMSAQLIITESTETVTVKSDTSTAGYVVLAIVLAIVTVFVAGFALGAYARMYRAVHPHPSTDDHPAAA